MRINVALDCIIFGLQKFGGISTYWRELISFLSRRPDVALRLNLPHVMRHDCTSFIDGLNAEMTRSAIPNALARYTFAGRAANVDLVHSSYYRTPIRTSARTVISVYDFTYEKFARGLSRTVHSKQKLAAVRRADGVVCISESTRNDLLAIAPDIDPAKVMTIPLGVRLDRFYALTSSETKPELANTVLFVGTRVPYKEFWLAVGAIRQLPSLRIGIVGPSLSGEEMDRLECLLPGRWIEFGGVGDDALRVLYGNCFALIYPSSYEGFGLPVLEAMACGAPVVTSRLSSLPEVAGDAGLMAGEQTPEAYAEKLAALMTASFRQEIIVKGFVQASGFTWEKTFQSTLDFYKDLL